MTRSELFAQYIIEHNATIRQAAKHFDISKSTVHGDISKKLPAINKSLYRQVQCVLEHNYSVKHLRGGEATARKYKKKLGKT